MTKRVSVVRQRIMFIGDSITGDLAGAWAHGYAELAAPALSDVAVASTLPENGEDTRKMLRLLDGWLGPDSYALIHFNCGLHDLKRGHGGSTTQVPLAEYEDNLRRLVQRLQPRAARLIWATITPVSDGQPDPDKPFDRFNRDVDAYNLAARRVMTAAGIPIDDLHALVSTTGSAPCLSADGVHMTPAGNRILADQVAATVRAALLGR